MSIGPRQSPGARIGPPAAGGNVPRGHRAGEPTGIRPWSATSPTRSLTLGIEGWSRGRTPTRWSAARTSPGCAANFFRQIRGARTWSMVRAMIRPDQRRQLSSAGPCAQVPEVQGRLRGDWYGNSGRVLAMQGRLPPFSIRRLNRATQANRQAGIGRFKPYRLCRGAGQRLKPPRRFGSDAPIGVPFRGGEIWRR